MEGQQPAMQAQPAKRHPAWLVVLILSVAAVIVWYAFTAMRGADEVVLPKEDAMMPAQDAGADANVAADAFAEVETNPFEEAETNPFEDAEYNPFQ
jgi:hypothetical protein